MLDLTCNNCSIVFQTTSRNKYSLCRKCSKARHNKLYLAQGHRKEYDRLYRQRDDAKILEKERREKYASTINKNSYAKNKEKMLAAAKQRRISNPGYSKRHYQQNREKIRGYFSNKMKTDINFKLADRIRSRTNAALKAFGVKKSNSSIECLGCSVEELRLYLEAKFVPGMTWLNWGNKDECWSIDHIKPLSSFDLSKEEEFKQACHYTNLQPLWHIDNMRKGNH